MGSFRYLISTLVCVSIFVSSIDARVLRYQAERHNGIFKEEEAGSISCLCGNTTQLTKSRLDGDMVKAIVNDTLRYESCTITHPKDVCDLLRLCTKCVVSLKRCFKPTDEEDGHCIKERYYMRKDYFGIQLSTAMGTFSGGIRSKRHAGYCPHPTGMKTADIACTTTQRMMSCDQTCIFGHTLASGPVQHMSCKYGENKWTPCSFSECKPYLDCTLNLVSGGNMECYTATTSSSPLCYLSCFQYEEQPALARRAYECQQDGSWSPQVPFCVKCGSALSLVPAPNTY